MRPGLECMDGIRGQHGARPSLCMMRGEDQGRIMLPRSQARSAVVDRGGTPGDSGWAVSCRERDLVVFRGRWGGTLRVYFQGIFSGTLES